MAGARGDGPDAASTWVRVESFPGKPWARIAMAREPVNSMNLAFWQRLADVLKFCEEDTTIRGIIFYSGLKRPVFSAGNDLGELYAPLTSRERYRRFWTACNSFLADLYVSPLVTISAIRGACPAGGCCLSLACDYRLISENGRIGLNEVELGIPVPRYWAELLARTAGGGVAEKLAKFAQMSTPPQALAAGIVDEIVPVAQLLTAAETAMAAMLKLPDVGRAATKRQARSAFAEAWRAFLPAEAELGFTQLQDAATVAALGSVLHRLSGGKSGGAAAGGEAGQGIHSRL